MQFDGLLDSLAGIGNSTVILVPTSCASLAETRIFVCWNWEPSRRVRTAPCEYLPGNLPPAGIYGGTFLRGKKEVSGR